MVGVVVVRRSEAGVGHEDVVGDIESGMAGSQGEGCGLPVRHTAGGILGHL